MKSNPVCLCAKSLNLLSLVSRYFNFRVRAVYISVSRIEAASIFTCALLYEHFYMSVFSHIFYKKTKGEQTQDTVEELLKKRYNKELT